jgi:hypothetical protein
MLTPMRVGVIGVNIRPLPVVVVVLVARRGLL